VIAAALLAAALLPPAAPTLFDDFSYGSAGKAAANGWIVRGAPGWPGVRGARWAGVTFGGGLMRLAATTDGTRAGTTQAQVCHERKYREGTYAARVRFRDQPVSGPDGDRVVETFYAISVYEAPLRPDYSETDFEYLPNGGWGATAPNLYVTTWETFRPEPDWLQISTSSRLEGSRDGWRTLVLQVVGGRVVYFVDGRVVGEHGGRYYPESPMSINFNLWFLHDGLAEAGRPRRYAEDVDWVFHAKSVALTPKQVAARVSSFRRGGTAFVDSVPASGLPSTCNL
jgi:hypothetical protein